MCPEQIDQFLICLQHGANLIIELDEIPHIVGICTLLEAIIGFQFGSNNLDLTKLVDVIPIRIAQPKVGGDGVLELIVLSGTIYITLQQLG